jgi:hypothetical protein
MRYGMTFTPGHTWRRRVDRKEVAWYKGVEVFE